MARGLAGSDSMVQRCHWNGTKWSFAKRKEAAVESVPKRLNSFEVDPGDEIGWCGRRCKVIAIDRQTAANKSRPGVYITVEVEGIDPELTKRLHYYDDEKVLVWQRV